MRDDAYGAEGTDPAGAAASGDTTGNGDNAGNGGNGGGLLGGNLGLGRAAVGPTDATTGSGSAPAAGSVDTELAGLLGWGVLAR